MFCTKKCLKARFLNCEIMSTALRAWVFKILSKKTNLCKIHCLAFVNKIHCKTLPTLFWDLTSSVYLQIGQKLGVRHEKPYSSDQIHPLGTDRWPTTADSDFFISTYHLHGECNWKSGHHYPHISGFSPEDCDVLFPPKFFLLRNLIHFCLHS